MLLFVRFSKRNTSQRWTSSQLSSVIT
ncbi:hypothetical protein LINPERPRIM_LOCUS20282 [Linum perenne]